MRSRARGTRDSSTGKRFGASRPIRPSAGLRFIAKERLLIRWIAFFATLAVVALIRVVRRFRNIGFAEDVLGSLFDAVGRVGVIDPSIFDEEFRSGPNPSLKERSWL